MGSPPAVVAPVERQGAPSSVRLWLLEPRDSPYAERIVETATEAGLQLSWVKGIEDLHANELLIGIGPSVSEPLQLARQLRASGAQPLLVFFTDSASARGELHAELIRDPFLYPRFELVELRGSARQLASRLTRVQSRLKRQLHATTESRRHWARARGSTSLKRFAAKGEHYLAHFLAHTRDAILSTDETGRVEAWNYAAQRLFGLKSDAALGRNIDVLDAPDTRGPRLSSMVKSACASGVPQEAVVACVTGTGEVVHISASVAPIRDSKGSLLGLSVIARDDSEYQQVQEALREANRQKDEFLAIMSHELRTPLTSILGYTDMLLRGLSGPLAPTTNRYVGNVRSAGDRLLELVNSLLDYTRLEAGVERLELRPVDLKRVITMAVERARGSAGNKSIDLQVSISNDAATKVQADEERLTHVVCNFLNNAVKYTPEGGSVRVSLGCDPSADGSVLVAVADSGIGMREEQITRVWERFYQGDPSLTRPYGGMGLGLSIARHLITLHGGTVGAESRGPGLGSTFWFSLPSSNAA